MKDHHCIAAATAPLCCSNADFACMMLVVTLSVTSEVGVKIISACW